MHLAESQNDSTTINEIWINLGILNQRMSANDKAIDIFNHTYQYCQNRGDTNGMAIILLNMANIYYPDNIKEAERHYEQSLRLSKKINYQYNTAIVLSNLGELEIFKNNYSKATEYILENINLCKKQGLNEMLSISYRLLAQCEIEAGNNPASASEYLETARKLAIETGRSDLLEKIKEVELMMQVKTGNYPGFKAVLKELKELSDKSKQENASIINSEFQTIYEVKKLSDQRDQLLDGIEQKNRQLILSLLALLGAVLAIAVITRQYFRIRQVMKTMYRMNVEMANSASVAIHNIPGSGIEYEELPAETEDDEKIPINNLYNAILLRIEKDKLYLSPTFSLQDLSENMNRSQRYISRAISEAGKTSFSSLINNFRINEARRLLAADHNITINEITEKTGFGSRISFHRNFKSATGFTPAEYQNWSKNQSEVEKEA
jgi:AraC-like DNA-binding protein